MLLKSCPYTSCIKPDRYAFSHAVVTDMLTNAFKSIMSRQFLSHTKIKKEYVKTLKFDDHHESKAKLSN